MARRPDLTINEATVSPPEPSKIQQLRSLASTPDEHGHFAITLLNARHGIEVVLAALQVLTKKPLADARPALLALFAHYTARGETRDPSAFLRATIMRALRPVVQPADADLLAQATATTVFPPPTFKEEGALLRSAALLALAEVDENLARYHAVRLLANQYTDPMSGEPALIAARLLAAYEEVLPLYFYVMQDGAHTVPEVVAECLRQLTRIPEPLLSSIIEHFATSTSSMALVGLFDLLLNHRTGPHGLDFLRKFLRDTLEMDFYRYLVTTMVAAGNEALLAELMEAARFEQRREKIASLQEALALLPPNPEISGLIRQLKQRVPKSTATRKPG